jgi:hypothetical protein
MRTSPLLFLALALAFAGCNKKQEAAAPQKTNETASGNPITAPVDYLGAVAKAKHFSEKTIDTASMTKAIQLFYAQEDRFPNDLNELVSKHYIGGVPPAPPGMRWEYNAQTGDLKIVKQQ